MHPDQKPGLHQDLFSPELLMQPNAAKCYLVTQTSAPQRRHPSQHIYWPIWGGKVPPVIFASDQTGQIIELNPVSISWGVYHFQKSCISATRKCLQETTWVQHCSSSGGKSALFASSCRCLQTNELFLLLKLFLETKDSHKKHDLLNTSTVLTDTWILWGRRGMPLFSF